MNAVNLRATAPSGRTIVDHLLDYWKRKDVVGFSQCELALVELNKFLIQVRQLVLAVLQRIATLPPSVGYEPLLIKCGANPLGARGMAHLTVHRGRRVARESRRRPAVV
jgi:hypothetical protein